MIYNGCRRAVGIVQDNHERAPRPGAYANHPHRLAFFDDGAFTGMFSDTSLRRFQTLLTFQHPPGLRSGMRVSDAEVAGLEVGGQDLNAVKGSLTEGKRTDRRAMFAAVMIGCIGLDRIQPRRSKRYERDAVRPHSMTGVGQR